LGVIYAMPVLYGEDPAVQITTRDSTNIPTSVKPTIIQTLSTQQIPHKAIKEQPNNVVILFKDTESQLKAKDYLQAALGNNYSVALNLVPRTPAWLLALGARPIKLGLDLSGGVHFLLSVDVDSMVAARAKSDMHSMGDLLREQRIRYTGIDYREGKGLVITFRTTEFQKQALPTLRERYSEYQFSTQELDGSPVIVGQIAQTALTQLQSDAVQQNLSILQSRVAQLGIAEAVIQQQGANQISVDLPGIQDMAQAKDLIGKMATIRLYLVDTEHDAAAAEKSGITPFGSKLFRDEESRPILLKSQEVLTGNSIINANAIFDENGRPAVSIRIGGSAVTTFNRITGENIGKPMATVYEENQTSKELVNGKIVNRNTKTEKVINVATIQSALGNSFQVTGLSSMQYAQNLALLLRSGAYSARMNFIQERVIGPSLGKQNVQMGERSLVIGSILVFIFMALYYRLFGLIADMALILNVIFIIAILSIIGTTLTLPGIAGMVLTVGIAVDANVLINERIREELRNGKSPVASINAGYDRAFTTIVDSNVTNLIVAVILMALGSGTVSNFALVLLIGLLCSMVTSIFFTRTVVNLIYGNRYVKRLSIGIPNPVKATAKQTG
jgi:preprotein translocase subunit SecD